MNVAFGHVGGIPFEEGLLAIAPTACVVAVLVRTRIGAWLRRR